MLTIRTRLPFDMRSDRDFDQRLDAAVGDITDVLVASSRRLVLRTDEGVRVELRGRFDLASERTLSDSTITSLSLTKGGETLLAVSGFGSVSFADFERGDFATRWTRSVSRDGVRVVSGNGDDDLLGGSGADVLVALGGDDRLFGGGGADRLNGGSGADVVYGSAGNDLMTGNGGDDRLNGGAGADRMLGGPGNDTYWVQSAADRVVEAGAGTDRVLSSISFTLPAHVENLDLLGRAGLAGFGNVENNVLRGNAGANTLVGRSGDDVLDGGGGADRLFGGGGDDTYFVDDHGDRVFEVAGHGNDTVWSTRSYTLPAHVENLLLEGAGATVGAGNDADNVLAGSRGNNALNGGAGNDLLDGGQGLDTLSGGPGADRFVFDAAPGDAHRDVVTDFESGTDVIVLDLDVFTALAAGVQASTVLRFTGTPADGDDFLVYDQADGVLYYDASGSGAALEAIVDLGDGTVLQAADLFAGADILATALPRPQVEIRAETSWSNGVIRVADADGGMTQIIDLV